MQGILSNINKIQITSNKNFVSIELKTQQLMETFCSEHLLVRGFNIELNPNKRKPPPQKKLSNISFLDIPAETREQLVTKFLTNYTDIEDFPRYVKKSQNGVEYSTGIRVYQVSRIYQHISQLLKSTKDDPHHYNYDSDKETDQEWKQPRKSISRKQRHTQHRKQNNNIHNNITHRKNRHNNKNKKYTMENQPPDNNKQKLPNNSKISQTKTSNTTTGTENDK